MHDHDTAGRFVEQDLATRFWRRVVKTDGCWESRSVRKRTGYGHIQVRQPDGTFTSDSMHRVSWRLHFGKIPPGLYVLHRCDNRPCVRPDHLFLGTLRDNHADMVSKGRHPRGETHGMYGQAGLRGEQNKAARLTEDEVIEIRRRRATGERRDVLAREYGISINTLNDVIYRSTWKHLP